ncbi:Protein of unknown function (AntA/AntB antirepressor domain) [Candidatus Hamiltonella defensa (Bemisia tabaci)]|nr:Protein of unknown function (AntA/AntB antirepressor domain) [Candidatus Hamiltonella defensa (Bemisia tabaci)]
MKNNIKHYNGWETQIISFLAILDLIAGCPFKNYVLTLEKAKEISMLERSDYFIH